MLERNVIACSHPDLGHFVKSTLHLNVLQELTYLSHLLHEGVCQICYLSRQVLVPIWGGRAQLIGILGPTCKIQGKNTHDLVIGLNVSLVSLF